MTKRKKKVKRYTYAENLRRNERLKADLKALPVSYVPLKGHFIEGMGTENARNVEELSFFVIGNLMPEKDFKQAIMDLGAKYNQDSIAFKPADEKNIYGIGTQDFDEEKNLVEPGYGKEILYGEFHPAKIGEIYSKFREHPFTFTAISEHPEGKTGCQWRVFLRSGGEMKDEFGKVIYSGFSEDL
jgi:hypothetical protein